MDALNATSPAASHWVLPKVPIYRVSELARRYPHRGDEEHLEQVGRWGAALCSIGVESSLDRVELLAAAASFNVAVSLIDSLVDDDESDESPIAEALRPDRLRIILADGAAESGHPSDEHDEVLVDVFESLLNRIGSNWRHEPKHIEFLGDLLQEMYDSEFGRSRDEFSAKQLPVVFLGAIGTSDEAYVDLFHALGRFIAAWDDWLDQYDDLTERQANVYFGSPRGLAIMTFYGRAAWRLVRGAQSITKVTAVLNDRLDSLITAVRLLPQPGQAAASGFLGTLVG